MKALACRSWLIFLWTIVAFGCASTAGQRPAVTLSTVESESQVLRSGDGARAVSPQIGPESTLSDYLGYAALNNPGLEAAFNRWKAALEKIPQVSAMPDPRFTYGYFIQAVETRVGPQRQRFGISQVFPWFGKLNLRGDRAARAAGAEEQRFQAAKFKLFYQVKNYYYEYYYLSRAIAITEQNLQLLRYFENVARSKYSAGLLSYSDVVKAQVELGKIEDSLRALKELRVPQSAKLNAVLNRSGAGVLPWPTEITEQPALFSDEQLLTHLKEANPTLKALDFAAAGEQVGIELAKKEYFPDITLGVEVIDTESAVAANVRDSGKDPVVATVSINLPIWLEKYRAGEREAVARYVAARKEREDGENTLVADLKMALYGFRDAERKIDLYKNALIPKAQESIRVIMQGFEAGNRSFLDLVDAERSLLEFQLTYERSIANRAQRLAELEMLMAGDFGPENPTSHGKTGPTEKTESSEGITR